MKQERTTIRLSVSEAAKLFGISQRTVRRALQEETIEYVLVQGRYKIHLESLLVWSHTTTTVRNKRDRKGIGQYVRDWHPIVTEEKPSKS